MNEQDITHSNVHSSDAQLLAGSFEELREQVANEFKALREESRALGKQIDALDMRIVNICNAVKTLEK
jgi:prefoldin subunit 5